MSEKDQLLIPPEAMEDAHSLEIIRVWIAKQEQHFTLLVGLWDDPAAWGILLADLAKNIANSYEQDSSCNRAATLDRIKKAFEAEF
jgi:hypothetical protein